MAAPYRYQGGALLGKDIQGAVALWKSGFQ
jgi:hypothetical protein